MTQLFKIVFCLLLILSADASAFCDEIKTIQIVTPAWEGQTNEDGTGLFFDLVRKIYAPEGIKMNYEIVPWKRAEMMVAQKAADAMLCVLRHNIGKDMLSPKHPMSGEYTAAVFKKEKIEEWKGRETLEDWNLIWLRGYDFQRDQYLKDLNLTWDEVISHSCAWKRMEADRDADILIDAVADIESYIQENNIDMNSYRVETLWSENAYIAYAKSEKSKKLIEIYDRRIIELLESGELRKLF